jgi:NDP-sugar pyrophosphorylase family protein
VPGIRVLCVPETQPLGTAGGFLHAAAAVTKATPAWLVLNGDSLALAPLGGLAAALDDTATDGALLGVPMQDASRYGTIRQDALGRLSGFTEKRAGAGIINACVYVFRASMVATFPSRTPLSFETDVFPALAARGARLAVRVAEAAFLDIGTPESLPQAEAFVRHHPEWFG